jgi:GTP-binding protein
MKQSQLRNIAIIAHVDHGKTTLVDAMLKQTATFAAHQKENQQTTILDSNDLERERGVTILAKNTAVFWEDYKINILDTPGHADFSGEVERVLNMADGCILLVDAAEGVLSQTRFVLKLALSLGLKPMVLINKVDKKNQRVEQVENEVGDLFLELATSDDQLDFTTLYSRGLEGIAGTQVKEESDHTLTITDSTDLTPLFTAITNDFPAPTGDDTAPLQIQVNSLDWDNHLGKIVIGRIFQGTLNQGDRIALLDHEGNKRSEAKIEQLFTHSGLSRQQVESASAGEIIALTGLPDPKIGETIADLQNPQALPVLTISEPTVQMLMSVNTSPFAGKDAEYSTSRQIRNRLDKEIETNVGLRVKSGETGDSTTIVGRGELHISILIETMRREGYEFSLSRPEVVIKEVDGVKSEPWEYLVIDVQESFTGTITAALAQRQANMINMQNVKSETRFEYHVATANLIGLRNELMTTTSGSAIINSSFLEYRPMTVRAEVVRGGAIVSQEQGTVTAYSLEKSQQRGRMLVDPGDEVYSGQVVGINNRSDDMIMNVVKGKKLTNMRASGSDDTVSLTPAWRPSLEEFLTMISEDEMLEVTPGFMRLRKKDFTKALKR